MPVRFHYQGEARSGPSLPQAESKYPSGKRVGRSASKGKIEKKLDELWRQAVLKKWNYRCAVCGKTENLQAAHIMSRRHKALRWDLRNGIALCIHHHLFWAHKEPVQFFLFLKNLLGEEFLDQLQRDAQTIVHYDTDDLQKIGVKLEEFIRA